jgi:antitoxin CcdA
MLIGNTNGITSVSFLKSVTISAKVPASLKRKLERYRIVVSEVVRTALEREVMKVEHNDLARRLDEIASKLSPKLEPDDVVAAVRSSRRER